MEDPTLEEETPEFISSPIFLVSEFLSTYGWYILLALSALYYLWVTLLKQKVRSVVHDSAQEQQFKSIRENAVENARIKQQQRYDDQAKLHSDKMIEIEKDKAEKRKEMYRNLEKLDGDRLGGPTPSNNASSKSKSSQKKKESLTPGYFPMMGAGSSALYRPSSSRGAARGG